MTRDHVLARLDAALAELREIRDALAGEHAAAELTADEIREIDELAAERAARMRRAGGRP